MLILPILLCIYVKIATAEIISERFYNINHEMPHLKKLEPRILTPGEDKMISIKIGKPNANDNYYQEEYPIEEVNTNIQSPHNPNSMRPISNEGKRRVNELGGYLRGLFDCPVALLIQDELEVTRTAGLYMNYILRNPALQNDFWLMKYNASGVSNVITQSGMSGPERFQQFLHTEVRKTKKNVGVESEKAASFFSMLKATRTLPPGAAILMFTNSPVEDEDLAQLAIKETINKQIRLLVVWQGAYPTFQQEYKLLEEATSVTHGVFIVGNTERMSTSDVNYVQVSGVENPVITHLTGVHGQQQVSVPIENGVTAIHVSLSNTVQKAKLRTPKGSFIDLLNTTDVSRFAHGSYVVKTEGTFECELALGSATPAAVGVWRLETDALAQRHYDIVVSVRHALTVETNVQPDRVGQRTGKRRLHLNINGNYAKIDNVTLITASGERLNNQNLRISANDRAQSQDDIETFKPGGYVEVDLENIPKEKFYIQVNGVDPTGNDFQRISYYDPRRDLQKIVEPTIIQLGEGSEISQIPGRISNILYRVTNNRDNVIFMRFQATDGRSYLRSLFPWWAWINPHQTVIVTLQMINKGGEDLVTLTASSGGDRVDKKAIVRAESSTLQDIEVPHMWHKFTSNCHEVIFNRCEDYSWTMEVTAQDKESGLLLIQSSPEGLYFPQGYISGTNEEVTGRLTGSCCQSNVVLTAIDARNNRRSYEANAYWAALGSGSIAAIVISIFLVLLIIAMIVYFCICGSCKRKQKASHDIPPAVRYRGPENSATTIRY